MSMRDLIDSMGGLSGARAILEMPDATLEQIESEIAGRLGASGIVRNKEGVFVTLEVS
jgi:hypothetical protein